MVQRVQLTGKHAVGEHAYALVDDADYGWLSAWRWKAKPNAGGNNVYAVRNTRREGKNVTIRMHREIVGLRHDDPNDVDHRNHRSLDNRRVNLRPATRSMNILNVRTVVREGHCRHCGASFSKPVGANVWSVVFCSDQCKREGRLPKPPSSRVYFRKCKCCSASFVGRDKRVVHCSLVCRIEFKQRKRQQRQAAGSVAPPTTREVRVLSSL